MRKFDYNDSVARWTSRVHSIVECTPIDTATVLALIHIESNGDPYARREGSQFYGPLQIGHAVTRDVEGHRDSSIWHGRFGASVEAFVTWAQMYEDLHDFNPEYLAIGWKGGVGTLKTYRKKLRKYGEKVAFDYLGTKWNTDTYLEYFRDAYALWTLEA